MGLWDDKFDYSATELLEVCRLEPHETVGGVPSVGMGLRRLVSVAEIGQEFQGGCDGIDALCYHLDRYTCEAAIEALHKVLARFANKETRDATV